MIRRATLADTIAVMSLLRAAHEQSNMAGLFDFDPVVVERNMFVAHLNAPDSLVLVHDVNGTAQGILIAFASAYPYCGAYKLGIEVVIWINPKHRGSAWQKMRREYEAWAKERGCKAVTFSSKSDPRFAILLERSGYAPIETHYMKAL